MQVERHSGGTKRAEKGAESQERTPGAGRDGGGAEQVWREMRLGRNNMRTQKTNKTDRKLSVFI